MTVGLRERKKAATRLALHEAAVRLAIEQGAERVTVEAIADAAGVSRRTFSNYFANKEQALLYGDFERMGRLITAVRERPAEEPAWAALSAAAADFYRDLGDLDPQAVLRWRLLRKSAALNAQHVNTFAGLERELSAEIAARTPGADPMGVRARLTAAAFLTALRVALDVWLDQQSGVRLADVVSRSLTEAGRGFA
ncbi:TetR family transcriptional regulator [Actinoplanes sp. NPDC051633]|uniref:TetR/AcrR family transcriptional regulator n=1 Tax=Actinoplanes sp. NPDC051633 TaxID=3155670 RepID=UPI00341ABE8C